ncbi:MAG: CDP-diacylglycerol--glycerol-3-phosphate 3-phosphatidyltransferase [Tissierellia bacterium]|nr:CDP-diacylglycerol--glycerol-3-phosphate 3-phosphatidyltransferase [Tissierellia bacterium]
MNLANRITMLRLALVPVFIIIFEIYKTNTALAAIVFSLTAMTDFLDGDIARKWEIVTTFGKFMDPLVDKVLTQAGYIVLTGAGFIPSWTVIVIIFRELLITGLRTLAASNNITIAASKLGKIKTISQFVAIIAFLLKDVLALPSLFLNILLYFSVLTTVISGADYLNKNIKILDLDNI